MDTVSIVIIVVLGVLAAAVAAIAYQRRRSNQLEQRFGPEYQRTLEESGDRRAAERDLKQREKRRSSFDVQPLSGETAARYRRSGTRCSSGSSTNLEKPSPTPIGWWCG